MEGQLYRAHMLIQQNRLEEARALLSTLLSQEPDNAYIHHLLAFIRYHESEYKKGHEHINTAIEKEPYNGSHYYVKALLYSGQRDIEKGKEVLDTAIQHNPDDASYFVLRSHFHYADTEFEKALQDAEVALDRAPEDPDAKNAKSRALLALNRKEEAQETLEGALHDNPENSNTFAQLGWNRLANGKHKEANEHFKQALFLNPSNEMAKAGLVESIKAKNIVYKLFLSYTFWMEKQTKNNRLFIVIGGYVMYRIVVSLSRSHPEWAPLLYPLIAFYIVFALGTWIINPLANVFLLVNPYGRYALTKPERLSAGVVGSLMVVSILSIATFYAFDLPKALMLGIYSFALTIPTTAAVESQLPASSTAIIRGAAIAIAVSGILALLGSPSVNELNFFGLFFLFGVIGFQWLVNILASR